MSNLREDPKDRAFAHIANYIDNLEDVAKRLKNDLQIVKSLISEIKNND